MHHSLRWWRSARGAATTEKLFVILFAIILVGGGVMLFGPTLKAKYQSAAQALDTGGTTSTAGTLAEKEPPKTNTGMAVLYFIFAVIGFAVFVAPVLFPRARSVRSSAIESMADKVPFLLPLTNPDRRTAAGLQELRGLAAEVNDLHRHKEGALEIQANDWAKMASPSEATVDASFSEMPDIEEMLARAERERMLRLHAPVEEVAETMPSMVAPTRKQALAESDEIPFDAIDPSLKPQLQGLKSSKFDDEEATTVRGDAASRAEAALFGAGDDVDETIVHRSGPLNALEEARTTLNQEAARRPARAPRGLGRGMDATTQEMDAPTDGPYDPPTKPQ